MIATSDLELLSKCLSLCMIVLFWRESGRELEDKNIEKFRVQYHNSKNGKFGL